MTLPSALTIAGSDSSGGAGIQADLRTFAALEVYGASAITAVTSQNSLGVRAACVLDPQLVADQIDAVLDDLAIGACKTGMLGSAAVADAVCAALSKCAVAVVVDPVLVSSSGTALLDEAGVEIVKRRLLPLATLVTPNLLEASVLAGFEVRTVDEQERAARVLVEVLGAKAALVKGGHSTGDPVDVLYDGSRIIRLSSTRVDTKNTHGTGCTLSAAITAELAKGATFVDAVTTAHAYVHAALVASRDASAGRGRGPLHHMHPWYAWPRASLPSLSAATSSAEDQALMRRALALADEARALGEVPVGAVIVHDGVIVGEGMNRREIDGDPLAHAEICAIARAAKALGRWRLSGCTLVVTLEPCFMCAGALVNARIDRLVYGALDKKAGAVRSLAGVCDDARLNHRLAITGGVLADECGALLKSFFSELRRPR